MNLILDLVYVQQPIFGQQNINLLWESQHIGYIFIFILVFKLIYTINYNIYNIFQIDETTLTRFSCVFACRRFRCSHTYDKIAELLHEIICEFSIEREQLISTVTDNGSNFVKAFKDFGCEIDYNFQTDDFEFYGMKKYINSSMVFVLIKLF